MSGPVSYTHLHLVEQTALGQFALGTLIVLLIVKFCFSIFSFGAGVPGGIFLPLLVLGAVTGGIFAEAAEQVMDDNGIYLVNFVILGMVGCFSAIVRSPITGVILITEMTGDFKNFLSLSAVSYTHLPAPSVT